ncbi:MAG: ATP-binding protein [Bacteroidota bacterium]
METANKYMSLKEEISHFASYLTREYFKDGFSASFKERLNIFRNSKQDEQIKRLPALYLLAEHSFLKSEKGSSCSSSDLRFRLNRIFPEISKTKYFSLVLMEELAQEKHLALYFLDNIKPQIIDILGESKTHYLKGYDHKVEVYYGVYISNKISREELRDQLKREVLNLFDVFASAVGKEKVVRWFQDSYDFLVDNYQFLETFSSLIGLLPEFILTEHQLSLLSRSEIQKALIEKTEKLEKINKTLILEKEKAEKASRAKADFLSTMSHEIRTPMNALYGTIEYLLSENPREDQVESLKLMKYSSENLLVILNDILDFSKLEEGHVEFDNKQFSLSEMCHRVISVYRPNADEKGLHIQANVQTGHDTLRGDPTRLSQILNNLVSNAIKFTKKGSVTLDVKVLQDHEKSVLLHFEVCDTGKGIPKEDQKRIFERFTQLKNKKEKTTLTGTGLGLSISKKLLNLQQSDLKVKSEEGKGSIFYFDILIDKGEVKRDRKHMDHDEIRDLEGIRLLLVEDNRINQLVASKFLKKWNCVVDIADDGIIGLEKVKTVDYDVILMDLQMPGMNGYEASKAIRSLTEEKYKKLPIIALTADVLPGIRKDVNDAGMNDFISKPFVPDTLYFSIVSNLVYNE